MGKVEIERREVTDDDLMVFGLDIVCYGGCGKTIKLYWNGGELDYRTCCGHTYSLEHGTIYFVVQRDDPA